MERARDSSYFPHISQTQNWGAIQFVCQKEDDVRVISPCLFDAI